MGISWHPTLTRWTGLWLGPGFLWLFYSVIWISTWPWVHSRVKFWPWLFSFRDPWLLNSSKDPLYKGKSTKIFLFLCGGGVSIRSCHLFRSFPFKHIQEIPLADLTGGYLVSMTCWNLWPSLVKNLFLYPIRTRSLWSLKLPFFLGFCPDFSPLFECGMSNVGYLLATPIQNLDNLLFQLASWCMRCPMSHCTFFRWITYSLDMFSRYLLGFLSLGICFSDMLGCHLVLGLHVCEVLPGGWSGLCWCQLQL